MFKTRKIISIGNYLWYFFQQSSKALLFELSGHLAYAALLAFFPFLIFLVALGNVLLPPDVITQAINQIYMTTPKEVAQTIVPIIQEVTQMDNTKILTFSFLGLVWIASAAVDALRAGLNRAYECHETRSYIHCRLISLGYVVLLAFAMMVIFPLAVMVPVVLEIFHLHLGYVEWLVHGFIVFVFTFIWAFIYSHLPSKKLQIAQQLPGAIIAAIAWLILAGLFSTYLVHFSRYSVIYGSLSGVIITLLFFQLSAYIILLGAQINAIRLKKHPNKPVH
ncbi:MAG TPA: YihY/virulence factor BrkB family protein [Candidatus Nitrosotenuis sp.]|jgi:membrane protein|nr:YihY/virulence factor BrkB family protein [Candidatus Nitrosotenuis sp.]